MLKYLNLEEAVQELIRRRLEHQEIREAIERENPLASLLPPKPLGIQAVQLATSQIADIEFVKACISHGLLPLWLEYSEDRFSSHNFYKLSLVKLFVFDGVGKKGGARTYKYKIAEPRRIEGLPLKDIIVKPGLNLVDLHHKIFESSFPALSKNIIEVSQIWKSLGGRATNYYPHLFSLFICHGILFEDFHSEDPNEERFREEIVESTYKAVSQEFNLKPLIVRLPFNKMASWYPFWVKEVIEKHL